MAEWSKAADCKSVEGFLRRFESCLSHLFVVCRLHRIESRRKPPEGGPTERSSFFFSVLIQLYRMRLREVVEKR